MFAVRLVNLTVPVFEREARVKYSSQSSVLSSVNFRVNFLHGMSKRYEWYSCNLSDITET